MRLPKTATRLDYAPPRPRRTRQLFSKWGWVSIHAGYVLAILGFFIVQCLDRRSTGPSNWFSDLIAALPMLGGMGLCIGGIVLVAIAASRPG